MIAPSRLGRVLEATGYLGNGGAASTVVLTGSTAHPRLPSFGPEVRWRNRAQADRGRGGAADLNVYCKYVNDLDVVPVTEWQREVWNQGFSPLLWLVSPNRIELYSGFGTPAGPNDATANRLFSFRSVDPELAKLDALAGRLAMETGQFLVYGATHQPRDWHLRAFVARPPASLERALVDRRQDSGEPITLHQAFLGFAANSGLRAL